MNRGINLFVLLMTFIILGISVLIGFKAFHDLDDNTQADKVDIKIAAEEKPKEPTTSVTSNPTLVAVNQATEKTNISIPPKTNTPTPSPKIINTQARIDQQKMYMVIAGGFEDEVNAKNHQLQLKQLGYDAEVLRFKNSRLHIVCAGKFQNSKEASQLVSSLLSTHRIEAYVQIPI